MEAKENTGNKNYSSVSMDNERDLFRNDLIKFTQKCHRLMRRSKSCELGNKNSLLNALSVWF